MATAPCASCGKILNLSPNQIGAAARFNSQNYYCQVGPCRRIGKTKLQRKRWMPLAELDEDAAKKRHDYYRNVHRSRYVPHPRPPKPPPVPKALKACVICGKEFLPRDCRSLTCGAEECQKGRASRHNSVVTVLAGKGSIREYPPELRELAVKLMIGRDLLQPERGNRALWLRKLDSSQQSKHTS